MDLKLLIDSIVRQTMVLIAQLSTTRGSRSPLAHVADQVFLELTREIEAQGVRRQVVADMFGMALRSYQKKVRRIEESSSERERSLWQAVLEFVQKESPSRSRIDERFRYDGEREIAAVLQDLLRSGLIYTTGSAASLVYGATSQEVRDTVQGRQDVDALANLLWVKVFHREATTLAELRQVSSASPETLEAAIQELLASGRVREEQGSEGHGGEGRGRLESSNLVVPVGAEQGWESAIADHFRSVATAIAHKVRSGAHGSKPDDRVGGSTFNFTVTPGHPLEREVYELLRRARAEAQALWDRVAAHNDEHPPEPEESVRVSFYVGQSLNQLDDEMEAAK